MIDMKNIIIGIIALVILISTDAMAYHDKAWNKVRAKNRAINASGCSRAASSRTIEFNNVRAMVHTGGDMWWDLIALPKYEVPKNSGKTALFAGAIWMGGTDINDQLRIAAQKFRNSGVDYWPGPLITKGMDQGTVSETVCAEYDKHYVVNRQEVNEFRNYMLAKFSGDTESLENNFADYKIPESILNWPGNGKASLGYAAYLAPYYDNDADGVYNPETGGDYPLFDLEADGIECGTSREDRTPRLYGDETMWWVYNDKGNVHTETNGEAIGMEVRAQYFAFATSDELNNMTFGNYALINRSTYTLFNTYFGVWTDADLGYAFDDYVGCDVTRGLGYLYNGKDKDGTGSNNTYGDNPPAIGVDFFEGPYMDPYTDFSGDTVDRPSAYILNKHKKSTGIIDPNRPLTADDDGLFNGGINGLNFGDGIGGNERWGMRRFLYFSNNSSVTGDPVLAQDYYNYLDGFWRDGRSLTHGGNGYKPSGGTDAYFMFPGLTDPYNWGTNGVDPGYDNPAGWTEESEATPPDDRRFVQSAGPFTLLPGAVNDITVGMVWARASGGGAFESVKKVQEADDKAQKLFDNCFEMIDGPDSPELKITAIDKELIIQIFNEKGTSNNYTKIPEDYIAEDPFIILPTDIQKDTITYPYDVQEEMVKYNFEGYQVFQVKDPSVTTADLNNPEFARQIFQCDIKNDVVDLINYVIDPITGKTAPELMVTGNNNGIEHTFSVTEDAFAVAEKALVNHKKYYFIAVAYAYNEYKTYNPEDGTSLDGQKSPYLRGRKSARGSIKTFKGMPHINQIQNGGVVVNSNYGDGIDITMIEGMGNGENLLNLKQSTIDEIMSGSPWKTSVRAYETGFGPLKINIIDPLNVQDKDFILRFDSVEYSNDSRMKYNGYINKANWIVYDADQDQKTIDTTFVVMYDETYGRLIDTTLILPMMTGIENVLKSYDGSLVSLGGDSVEVTNAVVDDLKLYPNGTIFSHKSIDLNNQQIITKYGLAIDLKQVYVPGPGPNPQVEEGLNINNGFLGSFMELVDPNQNWLTGLGDGDNSDIYNWIRSGVVDLEAGGMWASYTVSAKPKIPMDRDNHWDGIFGGIFSMYRLTAYDRIIGTEILRYQAAYQEGFTEAQGQNFDKFKRNASIDLVITKDTNLWSRCPVVEMCESDTIQFLKADLTIDHIETKAGPSVNNVEKFNLRKSPSVYRNGKAMPLGTAESFKISYTEYNDDNSDFVIKNLEYTADTGMGWFPGYAIDVETGERLNVFFGEDSKWRNFNGADMLWNPTGDFATPLYSSTGGAAGDLIFGGKHNVYVWGHSYQDTAKAFIIRGRAGSKSEKEGTKDVSVSYDEGQWLYGLLHRAGNPDIDTIINARTNALQAVYNNIIYVMRPMLNSDFKNYDAEFDPYGFIKTDITLKVRAANPYRGLGRLKSSKERINKSTFLKSDEDALNNNAPMFTFSTKGMGVSFNNAEVAEDALDKINVVPNPYYAYDTYELKQTQKLVKFTNLPEKCVITIYNLNGGLIRKFDKSSPLTYLDWDLNNEYSIEIASGIYYIHINVPGVGEKVLKWFGALRPVDLDNI